MAYQRKARLRSLLAISLNQLWPYQQYVEEANLSKRKDDGNETG